ncbi:MAG TPA: hypothetical protein VJH88_05305 [Candidatus Nanoarchaeia archaeon]|nr:hypothetical protein [Candidatus Nanoarchaeia archaeon]
MVKSIYDIKECPDCASLEIIYNDRKQQVVCKSCSLIYEPLTPEEEQTYLRHLDIETPKKIGKSKATRAKSRKK